MMRWRRMPGPAVGALAALLAAACTGPAPAGTAAPGPLPVPPGRIHVLLFVTPDCPIANSYAPEIAAIARECAGDDLRLFLVHVDPDVDGATARAHARDFGLEGLPLVLDPDQDLARSVGATVTPEAGGGGPAGLQ
jgi:hypothetical protein